MILERVTTGTETSEDCQNWFDDIEILFDLLDCTDERGLKWCLTSYEKPPGVGGLPVEECGHREVQ